MGSISDKYMMATGAILYKATTTNSNYSTVVKKISPSSTKMTSSGIVGINENAVPMMQAKIKEYIDSINSHLKDIDINVNEHTAFKGEYAKTIREFLESVNRVCSKLTTQFTSFNNELTTIANKYSLKDAELTSTVRTQNTQI